MIMVMQLTLTIYDYCHITQYRYLCDLCFSSFGSMYSYENGRPFSLGQENG